MGTITGMLKWQKHSGHSTPYNLSSKVDGLEEGGERRFLDGLAQRRVAVAGAGNVLCGGAILHRQDALRDQLPGIGAHDMGAQDLVGLGVRDKLDHALAVVNSPRPAVGHECKLAHL